MADEPEVSAEPKPKSNRLRIIIAILAILVTGDLILRAYSYVRASRSNAARATGQPAVKGKAGQEAKAKAGEVKSALALEPFLVNLADKDEVRYVKVAFNLGLEEKSSDEGKDPVSIAAIRDTIISTLSSKTSAQILTPEGKDKLREEVRIKVNTVAPKVKVLEVFIVEFVVQM